MTLIWAKVTSFYGYVISSLRYRSLRALIALESESILSAIGPVASPVTHSPATRENLRNERNCLRLAHFVSALIVFLSLTVLTYCPITIPGTRSKTEDVLRAEETFGCDAASSSACICIHTCTYIYARISFSLSLSLIPFYNLITSQATLYAGGFFLR